VKFNETMFGMFCLSAGHCTPVEDHESSDITNYFAKIENLII